MEKNKNNAIATPSGMVKDIFQDMSSEERLEALRNSADQVVNHSFTRPYTEEQIAEIRAKISELCIKISDKERELAAVKAEYKAILTPLETQREEAVSDLRSGGKFVTEECFIYVHYSSGKAGLYSKDGHLLNEMDITQEMSQATIFSALREDAEFQAQPDDDENGDGGPLLLPAPEEE